MTDRYAADHQARALEVLYVARNGEAPNLAPHTVARRTGLPRVGAARAVRALVAQGLAVQADDTFQITPAGVRLAEQRILERAGAERATRSADPNAPQLPVGYVAKAEGIGYVVKSRTEPGVWWLVSGTSCSCHAGRDGHPRCWHRTQVDEFVRAINEKGKRPRAADTGEAVTARFVD